MKIYALLILALISVSTAKAEYARYSESFFQKGLYGDASLSSGGKFTDSGGIYYFRNGKLLTSGNSSADGRMVSPAFLNSWKTVNSRQYVGFYLDPSARLTVVSLRARESAGGWYEASAACLIVSNLNGISRLCRALVERVKVSNGKLTSVRVSPVIPLADDAALKTMALDLEDLPYDVIVQKGKVKVKLTVGGQQVVGEDVSNDLYQFSGKLGLMIQGIRTSVGTTTDTAVVGYSADYMPHLTGRLCYENSRLSPCVQTRNGLRAFTVARVDEMLPGYLPIYTVGNGNLSAFPYYYTQNYGETRYLLSLGYFADTALGIALPEANCTRKILHRYNPRTGQHIFASDTNALIAYSSGADWVSQTSLACSLE